MEVLRTAILDKLQRNKGKIFSTSEVVKQMYPEDWELFLDDVNSTAIELFHEGLVGIVDLDHISKLHELDTKPLFISQPRKT